MAKLFGKKKYVSEDNLTKFSGMIQKVLFDMLNKFKLDIGKNIDDRFSALTSKQQGDSEIIEAREGNIDLLTNLKTFFRRTEHDEYTKVVDDKFGEVNNKFSDQRKLIDTAQADANEAKFWVDDNKLIVENLVGFVEKFVTIANIDDNDNWYFKFPNVMGDLVIQGGLIRVNDVNSDSMPRKKHMFPISFTNNPLTVQLTLDASHKTDDRMFTTSDIAPDSFYVNLQDGSTEMSGNSTLKWFAIGVQKL